MVSLLFIVSHLLDTPSFQIIDHSVEVLRIRITITLSASVSGGLVMNIVPDNSIAHSCSD